MFAVRSNKAIGLLAAGDFRAAPLREEPRDDALAVIALDFDDAVFARSTGSAVAFERLSDLIGLLRPQTVYEAHDAGPAPFARDANDAIGGH
jgi:hypothetical protein